nr:sialidase family protein [uncultured Catonella sp.]
MKKHIFKKPLIFSLALALAFSSGTSAYAAKHEDTKPANGTTMNEPFDKGTANSNSFRIPALLTLDSGRVVAAADARWNSTVDGGGFDTIVSYSDDNGKNWNYSFVNYLGDNGNTYNGKNSSCFIDPALATDGKKVWMLCDLYPYGVALNGNKETAPQRKSGFDSEGNLLLSNDNHGNYNYHLNLKDLKIYKNDTKEAVNDYTVDTYFNIKNADGTVDTNLFFKDSPYKVQRTSYLYLVSSDDGCKTFSAPKLLPLKKDAEEAYLAGPGRGLYTKNGNIIFPCYYFNRTSGGTVEKTSFVYSTDNGENWHRSEDMPVGTNSSESTVIELPNGNLRFFYRHYSNTKLKYIDAEFSQDTLTYNWKSEVQTDVIVNSATQMSAILYSSPINNKTTLLLSCPAGPGGNGSTSTEGGPGKARVNGRIFVGLINDNADNTIEWLNPMKVGADGSEFMYSCLTELNDGNIALLYENHQNGWGSGDDKYFTMTYKTYNLSDIIPDGHVGSFAFKEQLQKAEAVNEESYTKSSYKVLAEVITKAKAGLANKEPKEKLEEYAKELETAIAGLKKRGSIVKANITLDKAAEKIAEESKYTAVSLKALKDAIIRLKAATIDNSDINEEQMAELIKQVEDAINKLVIKSNSNSGSGSGGYSGGTSGGGGYSPTVPSAPSNNKPEEKKNEDTVKKPETQNPIKDKKSNSELNVNQDKTPQGSVSKKVLNLPSSKKLINLSTLKDLDNAKAVKLAQNKAKVDVSIASDALSELASKKVTSFAIAGKNFTVNLNSKNIKALSKLKGKQITLKVNKLKSGKFSVNISIDGKKLSAKEVAKLKIKVK